MFFTKEETKLDKEFFDKGYIKKKNNSLKSLNYIKNIFIKKISEF